MHFSNRVAVITLLVAQSACNLLIGAEPAELDEGAGSGGLGEGGTGDAAGGDGAGATGGSSGSGLGGGEGGTGGGTGAASGGGAGGVPGGSPCDLGTPGYQCVPALPGAAYVDGSADPAACPAPFAALGMFQCGECECVAPSDPGSCVDTVELFGTSDCGGSAAATLIGATSCQVANVSATPGSKVGARVTAHGAGDVACAPAIAEVASTPVDLCAVAPTGTCDNGDACVAAGDTLQLCVLLPGDVDCPTGRPVRTTLGSDSTCHCSCGTEQTCGSGAEIQLYQQTSCASVAAAVPVDGACHDSKLTSVKGLTMLAPSPATEVSCVEHPPASDTASTLCCPW